MGLERLTAPESEPAATIWPSAEAASAVVRSPPLSFHTCTQQRRATSHTCTLPPTPAA